jgi:hypothetical protein
MLIPFARASALENQVDEFLDTITQGVLGMQEALIHYFADDHEEFSDRLTKVRQLENKADEIRKHTETSLYTHSLIPESRGDVLALLENMDNVVDRAKEVLQRFDVERPEIPGEFVTGFLELTEKSVQTVDNCVAAARAYFRDVNMVRDFINKVDFYESEADRAGLKLKKKIFASDLDLGQKMHLRYFAEQVESISDLAEHVSERLAISAIKRSI